MYEIDKSKFGAFVAALRKEKGMTQKQLAEKLFLSAKAVSKWETGVSIPDTALLIPLAELLGVSVTELLLSRRMEPEELAPEQVEEIVKTAISYTDERPCRAFPDRRKWAVRYGLSFAVGIVELALHQHFGGLSAMTITPFALAAAFGIYFCFCAVTKLPDYYDHNRISSFNDGPIRMNLAGMRFTNANWPHILSTLRIWSCTMMAGFPLLTGLWKLLPVAGNVAVEMPILMSIFMAGLFIPLYVVGHKYE